MMLGVLNELMYLKHLEQSGLCKYYIAFVMTMKMVMMLMKIIDVAT